MPLEPRIIWSQHTVQLGGSTFFELAFLSPPGAILFCLQCLFSILMMGSFDTASLFALFFFLFFSASYSEIRLTISNISSPGLKLDSKLDMKSEGEAPLRDVLIRKN